MGMLFWKKKKKAGRPLRKKERLRDETLRSRKSQRQGDEILMKLDAIMTILRNHDIDVKDRIDQVAVARRILRETNLDEIEIEVKCDISRKFTNFSEEKIDGETRNSGKITKGKLNLKFEPFEIKLIKFN